MTGSVFTSTDDASSFFRCAPVGYAATPRPGAFDGVELGTCGWGMTAMAVTDARSSFFDDPGRFPPGTATLDSAFMMEGLETTWRPQPRLVSGAAA
ncbi:MAG: hypothetical protein ABR511_11125 [Acidimicrobiales bacterium]